MGDSFLLAATHYLKGGGGYEEEEEEGTTSLNLNYFRKKKKKAGLEKLGRETLTRLPEIVVQTRLTLKATPSASSGIPEQS